MNNRTFRFQKKREFGDCISDPFQFIGQHFKPIVKGFVYYVLPVFVLGGCILLLTGKSVFPSFDATDPTSFDPLSFLSGMSILMISVLLAQVMLYLLIYQYIQSYMSSEDRKVTIAEVFDLMKRDFGMVLTTILGIIVLIIVPSALLFILLSLTGSGVLLGFVAFIYFFFLMYLMIPLSFVVYDRIHTGNDFMSSIKHCFYLVKEYWWNCFFILLVLGIIGAILSYAITIPLTLIFFSGKINMLDMFTGNPDTGIWGTLYFLISMLSSLIVAVYTIIGTTLQYHNLLEIKEGTGLQQAIDDLGKDTNQTFENEGEY